MKMQTPSNGLKPDVNRSLLRDDDGALLFPHLSTADGKECPVCGPRFTSWEHSSERYQRVFTCKGRCGTQWMEHDDGRVRDIKRQGARYDSRYGLYRAPTPRLSIEEEIEFDSYRSLMSNNGRRGGYFT